MLKPILTSVLLFAASYGLSGPVMNLFSRTGKAAGVRATLRLHPDDPATVDVGLTISGLASRVEAIFYLPDELMGRRDWQIAKGSATSHTENTRHHSGYIEHRTTYTLTPDGDGQVTIVYRASIGLSVATDASDFTAPKYGTADRTHVAESLDYLLPRIATKGHDLEVPFEVIITPNGYALWNPGGRFAGVIRRGRYDRLVIAGEYLSTPLAIDQARISIHSAQAPSGQLVAFAQTVLRDLLPIIGGPGPVNASIVALPLDRPTDALDPLSSGRVVALDLLPFTRDRAFRLVESVAKSLIAAATEPANRSFVSREDEWIKDALPVYYAVRELALGGLADKRMLIRDLARAGRTASIVKTPLTDMRSLNNFDQEQLVRVSGVLALDALETHLRSNGNDLGTLINGYLTGSEGGDFWKYAARKLPGAGVAEFYSTYVAASNPPFFAEAVESLADTPTGEKRSTPMESAPFRILFTAGTRGNLELCGCKRQQAGGAPRRQTYFDRERSSVDAIFDLGNLLSRSQQHGLDRMAQIEAPLHIELTNRLKYDAIAFGENEAANLGTVDVKRSVRAITSANAPEFPLSQPVRVAGRRYDVVGWFDQPPPTRWSNFVEINAQRFGLTFAVSRLLDTLNRPRPGTDGVILMGRLSPETIRAAVAGTPTVRLILTTAYLPSVHNNSRGAIKYAGAVPIVFVPETQYLVWSLSGSVDHATFRPDSLNQRSLSESIPDDSSVRKSLDAFFNSERFAEAVAEGDSSAARREPPLGEQIAGSAYVGTAACKDCHVVQHAQWATTPHSLAYRTLLGVRRNHHPGCIRCHVVGFGAPSGYSITAGNKALVDVGCEVCHGPGSRHAATGARANIVRKPVIATCQGCHTEEHSAFASDPKGYWSHITH